MDIWFPDGMHAGFGTMILPGFGPEELNVAVETPFIFQAHGLMRSVLDEFPKDLGLSDAHDLDVISYIDFRRENREGIQYRYRIWMTILPASMLCTSAAKGFVMRMQFVVRDGKLEFDYLPSGAHATFGRDQFRTISEAAMERFCERLVERYQEFFEEFLYDDSTGARRRFAFSRCHESSREGG